ncbi:hypothetical protein [Cellulomonas sp. ATA003]|uniref:CIS tube protein n=1 Tax=Cellulomonas sp. ATA003 TaxID=3073064 RepID=UPI002873F0F4|nr:hypothetical protein [Cellulomonas sp. ATA003]WNB87300.1 hypothetical protein REH70_09475 [Cellulomonas sp. ATA003]
MERVAFIVEETGERIPCLLNPERLVHRRVAGLRPLASGSGGVSGRAVTDSPLLHTGGGRTEIDVDLMFDVQLTEAATAPALVAPAPAPSSADPAVTPPVAPPARVPLDVRHLTRPLWDLAENSASDGRCVPYVRFVWGKAWNVLAVVESLAERLERFDQGGVPGRSWVRMRLVRVNEPPGAALEDPTELSGPVPDADLVRSLPPVGTHLVLGAGGPADGRPAAGGQTLPQIAAERSGNRPWLWRCYADLNDLLDVIWPSPGTELAVPVPPEQLPASTVHP